MFCWIHMMLWSNLYKLLANRKYIYKCCFFQVFFRFTKKYQRLEESRFPFPNLGIKKNYRTASLLWCDVLPKESWEGFSSMLGRKWNGTWKSYRIMKTRNHFFTCRNVVSHWILSSPPSKGRVKNTPFSVERRPAPTRAFEVPTKRAGWTWFFLLILILAKWHDG